MQHELARATVIPINTLAVLGVILRTLWSDRRPIALLALALAIVGAGLGKWNQTVASTAQLVLTPLPLRAGSSNDALAQLVSEPMEVRTARLICLSDEAISRTLNRLRDEGKLSAPPRDIDTLRRALSIEVTIEKETPYETVFSPVIQMQAKGATAAEAKIMVDTWSAVCVELAAAYKDLREGPLASEFKVRADELLKDLNAIESEIQRFWSENNIELTNQRLNQLIGQVNELRVIQKNQEHEAIRERARLAAYEKTLSTEQEKRELRWTPSSGLAEAAEKALGLNAAGGKNDSVLVQEVTNPVYESITEKRALSEATIESALAETKNIEQTLAEYEAEMRALQVRNAELRREEKRLARENAVAEEAYKNALLKARYLEVVGKVNQPYLQVLSKGAEWRKPRFRTAILWGAAGAVLGLCLGACVSLGHRLVIAPALRQVE
jgi:uncharacterized protein involved in exopolysaccharide biosynthesis